MNEWTTETPTVEGWYWNYTEGYGMSLEHIDRDCYENIVTGFYHNDYYAFINHDYKQHWLGPLTEPVAPATRE